jgi:hypothetical protein
MECICETQWLSPFISVFDHIPVLYDLGVQSFRKRMDFGRASCNRICTDNLTSEKRHALKYLDTVFKVTKQMVLDLCDQFWLAKKCKRDVKILEKITFSTDEWIKKMWYVYTHTYTREY